jgi:hypothetical protein
MDGSSRKHSPTPPIQARKKNETGIKTENGNAWI